MALTVPEDGSDLEDFIQELVREVNSKLASNIDFSTFENETLLIIRGNKATALDWPDGQTFIKRNGVIQSTNLTGVGYIQRQADGTWQVDN